MGRVKEALNSIMEEVIVTYEEFGQLHTHEDRVNAAKAAITFLWGTEWSGKPKEASHLHHATQKLFDFSGDECFMEAAEEMNMMQLPDHKDPDLVEYGAEKLREAFNFDDAPTNREYWVEAIRLARKAAQ